jgi:Transport protein particle (TRAPP) component
MYRHYRFVASILANKPFSNKFSRNMKYSSIIHTCPAVTTCPLCVDMIHESAPVTNAFVSVPADMGQLNCAAFLAGIIAGVLDSARFVSHTVTYRTVLH